ncbi:MAG TPA: hypothetical protein VIG99_06275 [Myxococcaceae bacterium]
MRRPEAPKSPRGARRTGRKDAAAKNGASGPTASSATEPAPGTKKEARVPKEPEIPPAVPRGSPAVDQPLPSISGKDATRVVRDAAKILEQELAAGLMAAKRVEERFIDVKQIRERNPDEVTQRFRRDAHEALDIIFDVITVAVDQASNLTEKSFALSGRRTPLQSPVPPAVQRKLTPQLPTLAPPEPILPGQTAELYISVENDADKPTQPIVFGSSDLVNGERSIAGSNVKCVPNQVVLGPRAKERIAMQIHAPRDTVPGTYVGMFQAHNLPAVRAVLVVEVKAGE